jgi:hypothetical protein
MQVNFTHLRNYVYEADFQFDYTPEVILEHLQSAMWIPNINGYSQKGFAAREDLTNPNPVLQSVLNYFNSESFQQSIVNTLFENLDFTNAYWPIQPDNFKKIISSSGRFIKDHPNFTTGIHLDNRLLVASGMCYFINGDDPNQSTNFYSSRKADNPIRIPTGLAKGWMAANTENSWHDGYNRSDKNRYSILYSLSIKVS